MSNGNLKNLLTDRADAIRAKEGSSDPINPQDFSTRIANLSSGGSGSGGELEGEYFLAKPNGRYWKFNFIHYREDGLLRGNFGLSEEHMSIVKSIYEVFAEMSSVYTCIGQKFTGGLIPGRGIYYTTYGKIQANLGYSVSMMKIDPDQTEVFGCLIWQEACIHLPPYITDTFPEGFTVTSFFDYVKLFLMQEQGYTPSDEEAYALLSEMYMIEPITKEEYEDFVSKAADEDY